MASENPIEKKKEPESTEVSANLDDSESVPQMPQPTTEPDPPPPPPCCKQTCKKNRDWLDYATFGAEIIGIAGLLAYTTFAALQWCVMNKTYREIHQQTAAAQCAAEASARSADTASKQLTQEINNAHLDQRAWLGFVESTNIIFKANERPTTTYWFINTGKTPAAEVKGHVSSIVLRFGEKFQPKYSSRDLPNPTSSNLIMPNQRMFFNNEGSGIITQRMVDALKNREVVWYFFGEVCYEDIFKEQHHVTFCSFLNPDLTTTGSCQTYNQTDDNSSGYCQRH
jgi:hypothetical protein